MRDFHPRPDGLPRETRKSLVAVLRFAAGARSTLPARRPGPGLPIAIEAAAGVARSKGETDMATIGTFTAQGDGYTGSI
ncbi:MAG: hypothetical protein ACT6TH_13795, partial [Brevundimonas sp.]